MWTGRQRRYVTEQLALAFTQPLHSPRPDGLFGEDSEKIREMTNIVEQRKTRIKNNGDE